MEEGCLPDKRASLSRLGREFLSQRGRAATEQGVLPSVRPSQGAGEIASPAFSFFLSPAVFQGHLNFPKPVLPISNRN